MTFSIPKEDFERFNELRRERGLSQDEFVKELILDAVAKDLIKIRKAEEAHAARMGDS